MSSPRPSEGVDLLVLTNIQSPYNAEFYSELERRTAFLAFYAWHPSRVGRAWRLPLRDWERVDARWVAEARTVWQLRASDVILSGDYTSPRSLMRLAVTRASKRRYFWGERLSPATGMKHAVRRRLLSGFDALFAVGRWSRDGYRQVVGGSTPVHVLPYVCAAPSIPRRPDRNPVVGFVGSLSHRKGLDVLIRALAEMSDPPKLEVVGSGVEGTALQQLARDLNVNTSWLGELSVTDTNRVRASWWLQAVPSRYDGWGVVVNEGLASGVPVLASSMTGAAHDLLDGECGDIVGSADDWSAVITAWLPRAIDPCVTEAANRVAALVSAPNAAVWLIDVLAASTREERDFIGESLGR